MSEGIRVEIDDGLSTIELPKDGDHLGFISFPKDSRFMVDDDDNYFAIEIRHGKSSLVLMLERDQRDDLMRALGVGSNRDRSTYRRLQKLIDESGCLKVQARVKQLSKLEKETTGRNHRSHNFKKWFAGEKPLPRRSWYYEDYLPGHECGHTLVEDCRGIPPLPH